MACPKSSDVLGKLGTRVWKEINMDLQPREGSPSELVCPLLQNFHAALPISAVYTRS